MLALGLRPASLLTTKRRRWSVKPDTCGGGGGRADARAVRVTQPLFMRTKTRDDGSIQMTRRLEDGIARAARAHRALIAVEDQHGALTYEEFWRRSNVFADSLRGQEVRRVALQLPSSRDAIALYVGALLSGAVVVPIGAGTTPSRAAHSVLTASADLVVSTAEGAIAGIPVVRAEALLGRTTDRPTSMVERQKDDAAYVIFTSGSTGLPKGVPISHRNAVAFLDEAKLRFDLSPGDRVSQFFDLSFDVSVFDIFATLSSGATLVVPSQRDKIDPVAWISTQRLTHWAGVPSSAALTMRRGAVTPSAMPGLKRSMFIGERLDYELARAWALAAPQSEIINFYGPAEATVAVSSYTMPHEMDRQPVTRNGSVPIGTIFGGTQWRIVPVQGWSDEAGELELRGEQVFAGYLGVDRVKNHPRVPDQDGWYSTGDVVEVVDGQLVHLGRTDDQVKIGGYRVELGDVETHIRAVPGVSEAVVTAVESEGGSSLHCFYTGEALRVQDIRRALAQNLPHYMWPAASTRVEAFPLTPSGKVDRAALRGITRERNP